MLIDDFYPGQHRSLYLRVIGVFFGGDFLEISRFLERILTEHMELKYSLDSKLQIDFKCSIRIRSRNRDMVALNYEKYLAR